MPNRLEAATARRSAGVLDLRERHRDWRLTPARDTINEQEAADRHGLYVAILRTGMFRVESINEDEAKRDSNIAWLLHGEFTPESLRRLRDAINEALGG